MEPGRLRLVDEDRSSPEPSVIVVESVSAIADADAGDARADDVDSTEEPDVRDPWPAPGRRLREARLERGVTLDQISGMTKIPRASLELLEADEFEALPGPVFVKGFLRSCARAIDLDPETLLDLYYERDRMLTRSRGQAPSPEFPAKAMRLGAAARDVTASEPETEEGVREAGVLARWRALQARIPALNILLWLAMIVFVGALVMLAFTTAQGLEVGGAV